MVKYIIKLVLEFQFDLQNPLKQPKMWIFEKWKIIVFGQNYGIFWPKGDLKPCIIMYLGNIHNMSLVPVTFGNFFFKSSKNGTFWAKLRRVKIAWTFFLNFPQFFRLKNLCKITSQKKSSLTTALSHAVQGVKLPFLSKKCIFQAEKGIFSKSSFYTKMFRVPKYCFSVCQKKLLVIQSEVNIFHQIQPKYRQKPDSVRYLELGDRR